MRKLLLIFSLFLGVVLFNDNANAQGVTTASVNGIVSDSKGTIPGATVTITHMPTGTTYSTVSRGDGRFNLPNLRVGGPYTFKVSFIGYNTFVLENINLSIGQDQKIDARIESNTTALKEVTISASGSKVINSSRTGARETVSRSQIENLPTISRSLSDFTSLTPSANGLNFGGRSSTFNNLTVDGALFNNSFGLSGTLGGQTKSQPISLDAIDQIQVDIAPFDVRQGNFTGAGINTVVKSGTNTFKGTVYDYIRSTGLTGYKAGDVTINKTPFTYRQTGVSLGGPIIKNKLFFFVSGEEERIQTPANTYVASGSGSAGQTSNVTSATLDALTAALAKYGYNPGPYQNYNFATYSNKVTAKLDWNINKNNVLSAKYFYLKSYADQPPSNSGITNGGVGFGTTRAAGPNTLPFYGAGYRINNNFNIGIIELDSKLSNKVSNRLTAGYSALRDYRASLGNTAIPMVDIGNGVYDPKTNTETTATATATSFGYELYTAGNLLSTNIAQFSDDVTIFAGAHEITIGTNDQIQSYTNGFAPDYNGLYTYNSAYDFINGLPAQAYTYRNSALPSGEFPYAKIKASILSLYAQDKWHATDNLRVTYGLRADYDVFPTSLAANPNASALAFQGGYNGIHVDPSKLPNNRVLLSPRVGFNWDVFGNQTTQVRGGTGIFTGLVPFVWISNQASNNGLLFGSGTITQSAKNTPAQNAQLIFNPNVNANRPSSVAANTSYELDITDPKLKYPQIFRTNLAVDQKLPFGIIGTLEGAYTKDINAIYHQNLVISNNYTTLAGPEGQIRYSSGSAATGASNITPLNNTLPQSATNPKISGLYYMTNSSKGYSYFVTAQLQRSFANGIYANVAYTRSGAKDVNDGGSTASTIWSTRYVANNPNANVVSNSTYVQPNRVIATLYYKINELNFATTTVGFKYEVANNGAISYITSGDPNNDGATNDLMYIPKNQGDIVLVKNGASDTRTPDQIWQQLNSFISQDKYLSKHRGQFAERNGAILPYYHRLDFHAAQDFFIKTGKVKNTLEITLDIYNLGNLLNKNWGVYENSYSGFSNGATTVLKYVTTDASGHANYTLPTSTINGVANSVPTQSYIKDASTLSRWQGQLGLRYIFN